MSHALEVHFKIKKMKKISIIFSLIIFCLFISTTVLAQWYLDTATPEEAAARDKPFRFLQNEIQKNLCDQNWGIDQNSFKFFSDDPDWQKIVRGNSINRFDLTSGGDVCIVKLIEGSPLFAKISDKEVAENNLVQQQLEQGKIKMDGPEYQKWNKEDQGYQDDQQFAQITMNLNDDRVQGKDLQNYHTVKPTVLSKIPGVQQVVIYHQLPDEDEPDTLFRAVLYIGNFPKYTGTMEPVHYKSISQQPWKDKQHSGKPIIENASIWIETYHYNNLIKVIDSIDWAGLKPMVSE